MVFDPESQAIIDMMIKDQNFRRQLTSQSSRWFFGAYLGRYATHPFAPFHLEMFELQDDPRNKTIVMMGFRNSAKSTIMNTNLALWSILGTPQKKQVVILGATQLSAKRHFMDLRIELENNQLLRSDLGPIESKDGQWSSTLYLKKYDAYITFASTEQQDVRGIKSGPYRPDLFIADDIENDELVRTLEGRNKLYDWLTKVVLPAGDSEKTRLVVLGTLLHEDSIMMRLKKEILSGARDGVYREYPLLDEHGDALWKAKYPDSEAIEGLRKYVVSARAFAQEYLLRILPSEGLVVYPEWIQHAECPAPTDENYFRGTFIGIDPAGSLLDGAAKTAMVAIRVFGWHENMRMYVLPHPINERLNLPQLLAKAKAFADLYTVGTHRAHIYVEDFGLQGGIADMLKEARYLAGAVKPPLIDKVRRVALTGPRIQDGTVRFAPHGNETLTTQLVYIQNEEYKDLADAFSMLVWKIVTDNPGYVPLSRLHKTVNATGLNPEEHRSPYEVDIREETPTGRLYDPYIERRNKRKMINAGWQRRIF